MPWGSIRLGRALDRGRTNRHGAPLSLRVLLVDAELERAHAVRDGLSATGAQVVAILRDATDLPTQVRLHAADVLVCDMDHPTRDALDSMRLLHRDEPRPVVMFFDRSPPEQTAAVIEAGVAAYVIEGLEPRRVHARGFAWCG